MEIKIKIPKEYEGHYNSDKFKDSFQRIIADIKENGLMAGNYEAETIDMLITAFENSTIITDDCISRSGVIEIAKQMRNANPSYSHTADVVDRYDLIDEITDMPTIKEDSINE